MMVAKASLMKSRLSKTNYSCKFRIAARIKYKILMQYRFVIAPYACIGLVQQSL